MPTKAIKLVKSTCSVPERAAAACATLDFLRQALAQRRGAGAPNTAGRLKLAIASAAGAVRNAENRCVRAGYSFPCSKGWRHGQHSPSLAASHFATLPLPGSVCQ